MKIKPLKWEKMTTHCESQGLYPEEYWVTYHTKTPFGSFSVKLLSQFDEEDQCFYRSITYSYCFDEYYDEGCYTCESLLQGKKLAEKLWQDRLMKCLED